MSEKIVFILGAGFSKAAGAPLVDEFLVTARDVYANKQNILATFEKEFFTNVFQYHDNISKARARTNFDIDNIEDFFSIIDMNMAYSKGSVELKRIREALIYLIIKTLEISIKEESYPLYYAFMQTLYRKYEDFSFITFNYDLILERALENGKCRYNYCVSPREIPIQVGEKKILKLHGSSNWILGEECNHLTILNRKDVGEIYNRGCPHDSKVTIPLLIPPTWNKRFEYEYLTNVWYYAFEELKSANFIIFIGYSLPKTDLYFRHFLTLALKDNIKLKRITVVDTNKAVDTRFRDFLENNFSKRYLSFIQSDFRDVSLIEMIQGYKNEFHTVGIKRDYSTGGLG